MSVAKNRKPEVLSYNTSPIFCVMTMEYDFTFDDQGQPLANFSSDHAAFGCWFTDELRTSMPHINRLLDVITQLETKQLYEHEDGGDNFSLQLNRSEVVVTANSLADDSHEKFGDEGNTEFGSTDFYDEELRAACGLTDFKAVLLAWQSFVLP